MRKETDVQFKIKETSFFVRKLKKNSDSLRSSAFYFSAFLSSSNSILDHLLAEYNIKYKLGLNRIFRDSFYKNAKKQNNYSALKFIEWFDKKYEMLSSEKTCKKLMTLRNENVHRGMTGPEHCILLSSSSKRVGIIAIIPTQGDTVRDKKYNLTVNQQTAKFRNDVNTLLDKFKSKPIKRVSRKIILYIPDIGYFHIGGGCAKFLREIKKIVDEAHTNFP